MNKKITIAILLCIFSLSVYPQTINVADIEAVPGETTSFTLDMSGLKNDCYSAFSFCVQFPIAGFTPTGNYFFTNKWNATIGNIGNIDSFGQFFVASASANTLPGSNIDGLLTIYFTIDENVAIGEYKVKIIDPLFEYGYNGKDYLDNYSFSIRVVSSHVQILDETSTTIPEASDGAVDVHVKKTIKANEWSTICLPFAMNEVQTKEAFGDDVQLAKFSDWSSEEDENNNIVGIKISFSTVDVKDGIEANTPLLIKVTNDVTEFTVDGVEIAPKEEPSVIIKHGTNKYDHKSYMIGTYKAETVLDNTSLFLNDNKFWYSTGKTTMKAYCAYFNIYDILTEVEDSYTADKIAFFLDGIDTKVEGILSTTSQGVIYDLSGRKLNKMSKKGFYIVNGKKELIK